MKGLLLLITAASGNSNLHAQGSGALIRDTIHFNAVTRRIDNKAAIPFDRPFIIVVDSSGLIDNTRIIKVFAYKVCYDKNGQRSLGPAPIHPSMRVKMDTTTKKLILFMPPIRPNVDFDINIHQKFSDTNLKLFFKLCRDIRIGTVTDQDKDFSDVQRSLADRDAFASVVSNLQYADARDFGGKMTNSLNTMYPNVTNSASFGICPDISMAQLSHADASLVANKLSCSRLDLISTISGARALLLSQGLVSPTETDPGVLTDPYDLLGRIANLKNLLVSVDSVILAMRGLYALTLDGAVGGFSNSVISDRAILKANLTLLQDGFKSFSAELSNGDNNCQSIWLVGSDQSIDMKAKSASVISTDLGVANIIIRDNENKSVYLPKLYTGLNIFFRSVNRNDILNYLPAGQKSAKTRSQLYAGADAVDDQLAAYRTIWQHLSLSIGVTFGSIDQKYFDNLFNSMSLVIGPSYRFARSYRITTGIALLKRLNPNPLISTEKVTAGFNLSASVDFDFLQTVKTFTDLITSP
jgi:hypothetical protein